MYFNKKLILMTITGVTLVVTGLTACQITGDQPVSNDLPKLSVTFADPAWDGKTIPAGQHCRKFGGNGATPPLKVSGIPDGANAVIVEFNDESYGPLSNGGGHGKIGFWVSSGSVTLPAVPGGTKKMPSGVFLEAENQATGDWSSPGYLPPCSGGQGNFYSADVKTVYKPRKEGEEGRLLSIGKIGLGSY